MPSKISSPTVQPAKFSLPTLEIEARTHGLVGCLIEGERFDAGNRLEFVKAVFAYAIKRPDIGEPLIEFLRERLKNL